MKCERGSWDYHPHLTSLYPEKSSEGPHALPLACVQLDLEGSWLLGKACRCQWTTAELASLSSAYFFSPAAGPRESIFSHLWAFNKIFLSAWTATFWNSARGSTLPEAGSLCLSGRQGTLKPPDLLNWKYTYLATFNRAWCNDRAQMGGELSFSSHSSGGCSSILQGPLDEEHWGALGSKNCEEQSQPN